MAKPLTPIQRQEIAFNKRYSRFKIVFYFPDGNSFTHYGHERKFETVTQINFKKIDCVNLDQQAGFADCLKRLQWFRNKYSTALIYDRKGKTNFANGLSQTGSCVAKYVSGELVESVELDFENATKKMQIEYLPDNTWKLKKV